MSSTKFTPEEEKRIQMEIQEYKRRVREQEIQEEINSRINSDNKDWLYSGK